MRDRGRNRRRLAAGQSRAGSTIIACLAVMAVVAGPPATNGPSGIRPNAPKPSGRVRGTDHGEIDRLSLLSVNDIEGYWESVYGETLKGTFKPVRKLVSYDSEDPEAPSCASSRRTALPACTCSGWPTADRRASP